MKRFFLQLKTYFTKPLDAVDSVTAICIIAIAVMITAGCILASDGPSPPRKLPPIHLVTVTIDGVSVIIPIPGTNVEFKVQ